ncbi:major facilitator superfamily domain-containing protein [Xylariomycetidae sp. FL2044]|nr:major facilitator superfamily domain-containing protein [Xylariomycetidae sp. FL2044]
MSATEVPDPDLVQPIRPHQDDAARKIMAEDKRASSVVDEGDLKKEHTVYEKVDREIAQYASDARIEITPEDNIRLRRLIDRRVLVIMIGTYFLQAIDKGTLSFSSIMGLPRDTGLVNAEGKVTQEFSWLTTCIYITILVVEYPQNYIIARVPVAKYLGFSITAWGAVLACHAACENFAGLVTVRTLLGLFESACQPAFVVLSAMWYRREEQAARVTYWYMMNGAQQIVGGLLAYCFTLITTGPLKSWQWLFLSYGIISIFFGVFVFFYMPDSPMRAKCFTEEDKRLMVERVRDNQTGLQNRVFKKEQVRDALTDPQTWCYAAIQFTTTLPTSGLGAFANIIIANNLGFGNLQTQLLAMVLGFYIIIILLSSVWLVKRFNQNVFTMLGFIVPSFVGTILLMTIPNETFSQHVGLLICYYITLSFWSAQTLGLSMMSRNVGGQTKKTVTVAMNFIFWSAGNAIGPQVFLARDAPRYFTAFATHLGCYSLLVIVLLYFRWYLRRENKKRDQLAEAGAGEARDERMVHAFEDLTDRENPNFRYLWITVPGRLRAAVTTRDPLLLLHATRDRFPQYDVAALSPDRHLRPRLAVMADTVAKPAAEAATARVAVPCEEIVVEKLTKTINEEHLREIFGQYGQIRDLDLPVNRQFGTNRGTAYILYVHESDAEAAIANMHEAQLDGATINVSIPLAIEGDVQAVEEEEAAAAAGFNAHLAVKDGLIATTPIAHVPTRDPDPPLPVTKALQAHTGQDRDHLDDEVDGAIATTTTMTATIVVEALAMIAIATAAVREVRGERIARSARQIKRF